VTSESLRWVIAKDSAELASAAADVLEKSIRDCVTPQLLLATGKTPVALYEELVKRSQGAGDLWHRSTLWALDEYVGLSADSPQSFRHRLWQMVGAPLGVSPQNLVAPDGMAADPHAEAARYESGLSAVGYADVAVLGVGNNGHLAFNEPGTDFTLGSHLSELAIETRVANAPDFGGEPDKVPGSGITVGIATILRSRTIVLLAQGESKAPAINALRAGVQTPEWPITALLGHASVHVFVDEPASGHP